MFWLSCEKSLKVTAPEYALRTLCEFAGVQFEDAGRYGPEQIIDRPLLISYGARRPKTTATAHVHIFASDLLQTESLMAIESLPKWDDIRIDECDLQGFAATESDQRAPKSSGMEQPEERDLHLDIVASAFFLLTRYEEVVSVDALDRLGRFPASSSILRNQDQLYRCMVNEYAELLQDSIRGVVPQFSFDRRSYQGKKFAIALTRDIDVLHKFGGHIPVRLIARSVQRGRPLTALRTLVESAGISVLGRKDPRSNIADILEWESQLGIRSSFYFMSSNQRMDSDYDLSELADGPALETMADGGWEIGFHSGYRTYDDDLEFGRQAERLRNQLARIVGKELAIEGGRQHFLNFKAPLTWKLWQNAGMTYDSTLGFADHEGFRCGTCLPFKAFDLVENKELDLWELPLTVMDMTLAVYRGLSREESATAMANLLSAVKRHGGVLVLLWHNTYFGSRNDGHGRRSPGQDHDLFGGFIRGALEDGAFVGPAREALAHATAGLTAS